MAPNHSKAKPSVNGTSTYNNTADSAAPLADYFFICGVESSQIYDEKYATQLPSPPVEDIIEEDRVLETANDARPITPGSPTDTAKRRSRYSFEARKSIGSIITANGTEPKASASNRSSATIKGVPQVGGSGLDDDAFEEALKKFASERDSFLDDINVSAGVVTSTPAQQPRRPRPRTVRIAHDENAIGSSGLRSGVGSLRRRLSTMNSMKRQPSNMSRTSTIKTAKRMSGYNSVMPPPEPFQVAPDMHPLKRRYEPVLLDRYPTANMVGSS